MTEVPAQGSGGSERNVDCGVGRRDLVVHLKGRDPQCLSSVFSLGPGLTPSVDRRCSEDVMSGAACHSCDRDGSAPG